MIIQDAVLRHWNILWEKDDYYADYDIPVETDGISQLLTEVLSEEDNVGKKILEVGSGPGTRSIPLAKEYDLELSLADKLQSAHRIAEKRSKRYDIKCEHVVADAEYLPIDENSFDYVVSIGLNEHFFGECRDRVFSEMHRVTKKGGKTIVIVPNKFGATMLEKYIKELNGTWTFGPTGLLSKADLQSQMESNEFSYVDMYGVSAITQPVRLLPVNLQRAIFQNKELWTKLVNLPGNLNSSSIINKYFGEEIMAVGYK